MTIRGAMTYNRYRVRRNTTEPGFSFEARNDQVSQTLLIPGLDRLNPNKLFAQGQPGGWADPYDLTRMWIDDAGTTPATIASLGTGIGRVVTKGNAITLTQANAADRPVWGRHPVSGIRNILSHTESINNVFWTKEELNTTGTPQWIFSNEGPQGQSAFKLILNAGRSASAANADGLRTTGAITSGIYRISFFAKSAEVTSIRVRENASTGAFLIVNLANGTITSNGSAVQFASVLVTNEGGGWYRISFTTPTMAVLQKYTFRQNLDGDGTSGIFFTMPQYELLNATTPTTYQTVTNRFDITEVGSPSLYYFSGNGVNQRWSSNATVNFSGTDKVTVWAGAQRLSNAARGTIVELTSSIDSNNGAFHLTGPNAASDTFGWESKGTTLRDAVATVALSSPRRLVGVGDISGDLSRLIVDGTATDNTGDQGTGNYSNATLHVFSRGGSSQFFNGRLYSLIIAGGLYDSRTIARFADWTLKPRRLITA